MNKTKIDWTDWTWNPVTGCLHGCPYCYAQATARRWGKSPAEKTFEPMFHPERLGQVSEAKPGDKVFVCSMADLFGEWVPQEWIKAVIAEVEKRPDVIFQFLTKNPCRYLDFDNSLVKSPLWHHCEWPKNAWLGATATNQEQWDKAASDLWSRGGYKWTKFISCEPLLEKINPWFGNETYSWLIIGAQTGPRAVQPKETWVGLLENWADDKGIPVFHKDNLKCRVGRARKEFPN